MARSVKEGLDYFPLDVALNEKFDLLEAEWGLEGFAVTVKLYQRIYSQGYYCPWSEEMALLFSHKCGLTQQAVEKIVGAALKRGLFHKELYDAYGILTSAGIQTRFFEAVGRRRHVHLRRELLLIDPGSLLKEACIHDVDNNAENADINSQRREEKSREEKTREKEMREEETQAAPGGAEAALGFAQILTDYHAQCVSLPRVAVLTEGRKKALLRADRLLKSGKYGGADFNSLFARVEESDFLSGRNGRWTGCGFDWILKPANLTKILEGQYSREPARGGLDGEGPSYHLAELEKRNVFDIADGN